MAAAAGGGDARPRQALGAGALDVLAACAALLALRLAALGLTPDGAPPRIHAALAVGCVSAALLGGLTVARASRARRPLVIAWALALLWPIAGPPAVAASLAALGCAIVIAGTVRLRWGLPLALGAAAVLAVGVQPPASAGVAAAPPPPRQAGSSPAGTDAPTAPPARPRSPEAAVRAYYRALDARRFGRAWGILTDPVRSSFGGRAHWSAGFAATRASRPSQLRVAVAAGGATTVRHVLTATDRTPCGGLVVRRYAITWTLTHADGRWRATALAGRPLGDAAFSGCA